jgi:hypothetical protein
MRCAGTVIVKDRGDLEPIFAVVLDFILLCCEISFPSRIQVCHSISLHPFMVPQECIYDL